MSIKHFCDGCGDELLKDNEIKAAQGAMPGRLSGRHELREGGQLHFEVMVGLNGVSNDGDFCKYCVIAAVQSLDDRPRPA